jgi:hypothetical protein
LQRTHEPFGCPGLDDRGEGSPTYVVILHWSTSVYFLPPHEEAAGGDELGRSRVTSAQHGGVRASGAREAGAGAVGAEDRVGGRRDRGDARAAHPVLGKASGGAATSIGWHGTSWVDEVDIGCVLLVPHRVRTLGLRYAKMRIARPLSMYVVRNKRSKEQKRLFLTTYLAVSTC